MLFTSRQDRWSMVVNAIAALIMIELAVYTLVRDQSIWSMLLAAANLAVGFVPFSNIIPGIRYELTQDSLIVRGGLFFRWRIDLAVIDRVSPTRPNAQPGDLCPLRIDYRVNGRKKHITVVPDLPVLFMQELARRERRLLLQENCLLRMPAWQKVLV